mmetsp:Transcript_19668/g.46079  ORF Transcript_19668/g.46079 Transcript_19668/m.46079 type:complete len:625 (-) Transcript_19668:154-2028(-)
MSRSTSVALTLALWLWHSVHIAAGLGIWFHQSPLGLGANTVVNGDHTSGNFSLLASSSHVELTSNSSGPFQEVAQKVKDISDTVSQVGKAIGDVAETVGNVFGNSKEVTDIVRDVVGNISGVAGGVSSVASAVGANDTTSDAVSRKIQGIASIVSRVADTSNSIKDLVQSLVDFTNPVPQGGHSKAYNNRMLMCLLGIVIFTAGAGFLLETLMPKLAPEPGRPRPWLYGLLLASYSLLIPGIVGTLFSFTLAIELYGLKVTVTQKDPSSGEPGAITESMSSVVNELQRTGSTLGAALVVLYAMVIPALKLLFLMVGEFWRYSDDPTRVYVARQSIRIVQLVSKWACPDMFAYILLLYLLRFLDGRSTLIAAPAHLDIGFSCFSLFCVCSTFSSLAIHLPERHLAATVAPEGTQNKRANPGVLWATALLLMAFAASLVLGLYLPCMTMRLETKLLVQPDGPLPRVLLPVIEELHIEDQVNSTVSLWNCVLALAHWYYLGEATCIMALIMLGIFAIALPVANMIVLVLAAVEVTSPDEPATGGEKPPRPHGAMAVAHVLKHIEMLDVAIMGVLVVTLAGKSYQQQGVVLSLRPGLLLLLIAEVIHYVTYYMVQNSVKALNASRTTS